MKNLFLALLLIGCSLFSYSQNVGIGTTNPHSSAALDIVDTSRGILIPRMTMAQRNAIQNPAEGLMVYQTDSISGNWIYDGLHWRTISNIVNYNYGGNTDSSLHLFSTQPLITGSYTIPSGESWKVISIHKLVGFGATTGIGTYQGCTAGSPGWNNTRCGYSLPNAIELLKINNDEIYYGAYNSSSSVIELGGYPPCSSCPPTATFNFTFEYSSLSNFQLPFWLNQGDTIIITNNLKLSIERYRY